ncbi:MAG: adenosylhomocysteinase [Candidatus Fraserbacteria bacterium RBG_16_55_9]|uniref:Adenosylhomocysteinase n=1 Tax=Fraserbacteria sp. (strain RBG_16_55_9) TaxID=1817864 RepID=A0A1F5USK5_FRAXR|nr:MAG: adenosylhomocysteinase [Candidatus Fraserbacteria bacterium RBG_16_55_9]
MPSEVRDIKLAPQGEQKIRWAERHMKLLNRIRERFLVEKPFKGVRLGLSIHLEAKTAQLARVLHSGGAEVAVTGCNPLSTQDDVSAALAQDGQITVYAWRSSTPEEYEHHLSQVLKTRPQAILDDGGDLVGLLHGKLSELAPSVWGGTEETTTGVRRLRTLAQQNKLRFPMFAVNDAQMKYLFDNRYGTGQSVWDGIMRTTNLSIAGKTVVVAGYGWCGRGIAMRAHGLGANVVITEIDPIRAIEAVMDGFRVLRMEQAAPLGDIFVTATGVRDVITEKHLKLLKDGAILANAGHFDVEISKPDLKRLAVSQNAIRPNVEEFTLRDGRHLYLLAEGRLVNLASGDGHPVEIMDLSFAVQALTLEYLVRHHDELKPGVYSVPKEIDQHVARTKLEALGIALDELSSAQRAYLEKAG